MNRVFSSDVWGWWPLRLSAWRWLVWLWPMVLWAQGTNDPVVPMEFEDEFSPGFGMIVLVLIFLSLLAIGAGAVLAVLVCGLVAGLVATGMVSASVVVGFVKRSPSAALRALVLQAGVGGGVVAGLVLAAIIAHWNGMPWHNWTALLTGLLVGGGGGLGVAWLCNTAWGAAVNWLLARMGKRPEPKESHGA